MSLRIERISALDQLTPAIIEQWNGFPIESPMQSADWLVSWWQTVQQNSPANDELCILTVFDGDNLVAVAPWYLKYNWQNGNCLRFLGDGIVCSDHPSVAISDAVSVDRVRKVLSHWLRCENGKRWQTITFEPVDEGDEFVRQLVDSLHREGCDVHTRKTVGTWSVDLPKTWDEFVSSLSKNHRKRCRRWQREYFDSGRATITCTPTVSVERGWNQLTWLNQRRREQLGDRSVFESPLFHEFHLAVLPTLVAKGKAQIRELTVDDKRVAVEYVLHHQNTVFCYQSGMQTTDSRDGYGNLSVVALFKDAIRDGFGAIDFLRGDEEYKHHWGATRRGCVSYLVASKPLSGSAKVACYRAVDTLKALREMIGTSLTEGGV